MHVWSTRLQIRCVIEQNTGMQVFDSRREGVGSLGFDL